MERKSDEQQKIKEKEKSESAGCFCLIEQFTRPKLLPSTPVYICRRTRAAIERGCPLLFF